MIIILSSVKIKVYTYVLKEFFNYIIPSIVHTKEIFRTSINFDRAHVLYIVYLHNIYRIKRSDPFFHRISYFSQASKRFEHAHFEVVRWLNSPPGQNSHVALESKHPTTVFRRDCLISTAFCSVEGCNMIDTNEH